MADINKIKARLDALLRKARDGGSSDAEIAEAMAAAQRLMQKYGLSESDIENMSADEMREYAWEKPAGRKNFDPVLRYLAGSVCEHTGCVGVLDKGVYYPDRGEVIVFYGGDADVEYAAWLIKSMQDFLNDQWEQYKKWDMPTRISRDELRAERIGFVRGFCKRMRERFRELKTRDGELHEGKGTALVQRKTDLIQRKVEEKFGPLGGSANMAGRGRGSGTAAGAGYTAAGGMDIGRGIGQGAIAIEHRK